MRNSWEGDAEKLSRKKAENEELMRRRAKSWVEKKLMGENMIKVRKGGEAVLKLSCKKGEAEEGEGE